jgi:hypothetical protein
MNAGASLADNFFDDSIIVAKDKASLTAVVEMVPAAFALRFSKMGVYVSWIRKNPRTRKNASKMDKIQNSQGHHRCCAAKPPMMGPIAGPKNGSKLAIAIDMPLFFAGYMSASAGAVS